MLTHKHLPVEVWGQQYRNEFHMLRVNISNLQRKLETDPARPQIHPHRIRRGLQAEGGLTSPSIRRRGVIFLHFSGDHKNNPFADIGDAVGAAFQVMRDPDEARGAGNGLGVFGHES